jgi:hypothetical protein
MTELRLVALFFAACVLTIGEPPHALRGTLMADVYGAITDDAVNRVIGFAHVRAPFLFNYVAPSFSYVVDAQQKIIGMQDAWIICSPVPDSPLPGVPKYTRLQPFQLPGIPVKLPYSIQIISLQLDFHPGDILTLPNELLPPLRDQSFGLAAMLQFGLACVPPDLITTLASQQFTAATFNVPRLPVLPVTDLDCFVLRIFATGRLSVLSIPLPFQPRPLEQIRLEVDGLEIVDIAPQGLEAAVECYLVAMLRGYVLPTLVLGLQDLTVSSLGISVTPYLSPGLPHNPAIEQNELRVWLDLDLK